MNLKANLDVKTQIYKFLKARRISRKGLNFYFQDGYVHSVIVCPNGLLVTLSIFYTTPLEWWLKFSKVYTHTSVVYREVVHHKTTDIWLKSNKTKKRRRLLTP